jgi:predicted acylesterase/phospholipase RssA
MTDGGTRSPGIGLALGSGGARGLAHIGVIQVLEEHDISIDVVAGSSIGALVGALFGSGNDGVSLHRIASDTTLLKIIPCSIRRLKRPGSRRSGEGDAMRLPPRATATTRRSCRNSGDALGHGLCCATP